MIPVHLRVINRQNQVGEESQALELVTEAQYTYKNDVHYLIYEENAFSGIDASRTALKISKDKITVRRFGNQESMLEFQVGRRFVTQYPTPYGAMRLEITTQFLETDIVEGPKGTAKVSYSMMMQSAIETRNEMEIEIF